jgi:foldase protein PrsA
MKAPESAMGRCAWAIPIVLAILLASTVTYAASKTLIDPVVLRVNGEDITETEFLYFLMGKYGDDIADQLIEHMVLAQQAEQFGLELDPRDGMDYMKDKYTQEKLAALAEAFDLNIIAASIARESLAMDVLNKKTEALIDELGISVTDDEILTYYLNIVDELATPESARFAWILTSQRSKAEEALGRLDGGEEFADVAKDVSEDKMTADDGGEVGVIGRGVTKGLPEEIENTIFSLNEGKYSGIVQVGDNFFIIKTLEKKEKSEPKFEDVKDVIERMLLAEKVEQPLMLWLDNIGKTADIEVIYPIFQEMTQEGGMVPLEE